jgi:hypothetical protein
VDVEDFANRAPTVDVDDEDGKSKTRDKRGVDGEVVRTTLKVGQLAGAVAVVRGAAGGRSGSAATGTQEAEGNVAKPRGINWWRLAGVGWGR